MGALHVGPPRQIFHDWSWYHNCPSGLPVLSSGFRLEDSQRLAPGFKHLSCYDWKGRQQGNSDRHIRKLISNIGWLAWLQKHSC